MPERTMAPQPATEASTTAPLDLVDRIEGSTLETRPFHHIYLEGAFPSGYYRRLLDISPAPRRYRELRHRDALQPDGRSARRKFYLYPEHIGLLPAEQRAFWLDLSRVLRSRALQDAFKRKFRVALEQRFGKDVHHLSFYPVPILLRDFPGYRIGIHGDSLGKAITVQFYLPRDESQAQLATVPHEDRAEPGGDRTKRLPFRPATAYAFPVVYHASWHSVVQTKATDGERDSLMLTYFVQERAVDWIVHRLKRLWVFIAYGLRS